MLRKTVVFLCVVGLALGISAGEGDASNPTTVTWSKVRANIAETICFKEHKRPDGGVAYSFHAGSREKCTESQHGTPISDAIDVALKASEDLYRGLGPGHVNFAHKEDQPPDVVRKEMQETYLASDLFVQPLLRRLGSVLKAHGFSCIDCPAAKEVPIRTVSWDDFVRYFGFFAWPDPVRTPLDAYGKPGKPQMSFHICAGLNGVVEMERIDPDLERAGFIAAWGTKQFREKAFEHFGELVKSDSFKVLSSDEERTSFLRRELPRRMMRDESLIPLACEVLNPLATDLGLRIERCTK